MVYWYISTIDKNGDVLFMNYGYAENKFNIPLDPSDEKNRYSIQLYHLIAASVDLSGKDLLEVGSGRGGGLDYIFRTFNPHTATGVDLNAKAVQFCKNHYKNPGILFIQSNAESLLMNDASFDTVINIESSHGYPHMNKFLAEVYRVLKPDGFFLFADFRPRHELKYLDILLLNSGMTFVKKNIITKNVVDALDLIKTIREEQIKKLVPAILRGTTRWFAAMEGSPIYSKFLTGQFEYVFYILKK